MSFINKFKEYNIPMHGVRLPDVHIDKEDKQDLGLSDDCSNFDFLRALARKGFKEKLQNGAIQTEDKDKYIKQALYELETFEELGFVDYILIIWDIINFAKKNNIPVGPGRGSSGGSLIFYLLNITQIDPIKYGLYFQRFISKIRAKKQVIDGITYVDGSLMPDVDTDFDYYRRSEVVEYIYNKYKGKTAKICSYNTLQGKLLIKECYKIIEEASESEANEISKLIPKKNGNIEDIEIAFAEVPELKEWASQHQETFNVALKLRDLIKNKSIHASGILISYDSIDSVVPLELSSDKEIISQYDMYDAQYLCIKVDALGLKTISVIFDVCNQIGIDPYKDINIYDPKIYEFLQDFKFGHGVFQLETFAQGLCAKKVKPKNFEQLSDVLAIARPGASDFLDYYCDDIKENRHPSIDNVLSSTRNICLFQEQTMQLFTNIGFSLEESEILRRDIGKKKTENFPAWKEKIYVNCEKNNIPKEIGDLIWKIVEDSAGYQFNKSHSMLYAYISALTIYLKIYYPKEFFLAMLRMAKHEQKTQEYIEGIRRESKYFGVELLPPHLLKSKIDFNIEGNNIRFGLGSIKGVAAKSFDKIIAMQKEFKNKFELFEAAKQSGINIGILSTLIQCGCLSGIDDTISRSRLVLDAQLWNILSDKEKVMVLDNGEKFNYNLLNIIKYLKENKLIKESRLETIRKKYIPYNQIYKINSHNEKFANFWYETKALGFSYTRLHDIYSEYEDLVFLKDIEMMSNKERASVVGIVKSVKINKTKTKKDYLKLVISDCDTEIHAFMWEEDLNLFLKNNPLPQEEDIVILNGIVNRNALTVKRMILQKDKIYLKLSELKDNIEENQTDT